MLKYASLVEEVYETGARNFVFLGVPPLQRTPLSSGNVEGVALEDKAVQLWNSDLIKMSDSLRARHPDITSLIFQTIDVYNKVLDDPLSYSQTKGLKDVKEFCGIYPDIPQGNLDYVIPQGVGKNGEAITTPGQCKYKDSEYFWYNDMHPTSPVHDATASELAKLLEMWPSNEGRSCAANAQISKLGSGKDGKTGSLGRRLGS